MPFRCNMHPSLCTKETNDLLADCGCTELRIGLESGNDEIRMQLLKRNVDRDAIISAFANTKARGMRAFSFNIIGLPHETPRRLLDTIKLNGDCDTDETQVSIFYPYPGTKLFDLCAGEGLVSDRILNGYYMESLLDLPDLSPRQLKMFQMYFHKLARLCQSLSRLPRWLSVPSVWLIDSILSLRIAPYIMSGVRSVVQACRVIRKRPVTRPELTTATKEL